MGEGLHNVKAIVIKYVDFLKNRNFQIGPTNIQLYASYKNKQ